MISSESTPELETIPLKDLANISETKLRDTLLRAYKSTFYRDLWKIAGVNPHSVRALADLSLLPFVERKDLFEATRRKPCGVACGSVSTWFAGSSLSDDYEWVPYSTRDFLGIAPMLARMGHVTGLQNGDIVLAIVDLPPRIYSSIPYLWTYSKASNYCKLEFIIGSLDWYDTLGMTWLDFIQKRRPTVLFSSTKNALALANKINKELKVQAKDVLSQTRTGIFYGNPLDAVRNRLLNTYSLESYEVYSPTENMSFCAECSSHQGIHMWMDTCIPEIIPAMGEEGIPIWEASVGTKGELVISNFAECFPLLRYKTGESIRVEGVNRCACGCTHPRISRISNGLV
jgi:phenylacetate-CoA ligase